MQLSTVRWITVGVVSSIVVVGVIRALRSALCHPPGIPSPPIPPFPGASFFDRYVKRFFLQHFYIVRREESLFRLLHWTRMFHHRPFMMRIFFRPHIVISRAEDIEEILLVQESKFKKGVGYDLLRAVIGDGLLAMSDSAKHAAHRRLLAPIFRRANLIGLSNEVTRVHALRLLGALLELLLRVGDGGTVTVNLAEYMNRVALSIIGEAAFRASRAETVVVLDAFAVMSRFNKMNYFCPYLRTRAQHTAERTLTALSDAWVRRADSDRRVSSRRVVLDALTDALHVHLDARDVVSHLVTFLFAGHDTTSTTMEFMCALLARDGRAQARLHEALADVMPAACGCPPVEALLECAYLVAVLRETMRLFPAAPLIYRDAREAVRLPAGVTVPRGAVCVVNIFGVHRDVGVYGDDADAFRPERWMGAEGDALRTRCGRCGYMPFSVGKRNCIGQDYGYYEVLVVAALIVRHLRLELVGAFPRTGFQFTLTSPDPFRVRLALREEFKQEELQEMVRKLKTLSEVDDAEECDEVKSG